MAILALPAVLATTHQYGPASTPPSSLCTFCHVQESTGIETIDEMVASFVSAEDRNYALLQMINDLNSEIEAGEVENASLRAAVDETRSKGSAGQASRETVYKVRAF